MITKENIKSLIDGETSIFEAAINTALANKAKDRLAQKTEEVKDDVFTGDSTMDEQFIRKVSRFRDKRVRRKRVAPTGSKVVGGMIKKIGGKEKLARKKGARMAKRTKLKGGGALKARTKRKANLSKKLRKQLKIKN